MQKFLIKTVNQLYTGRRFLTQIGKDTKEAISWEIKSQNKSKQLMKGNVGVYIDFYFPDNRKDIDGCLKATLDCLNKLVWEDDRQVVELHVYKNIDKENPRTEIEVREA